MAYPSAASVAKMGPCVRCREGRISPALPARRWLGEVLYALKTTFSLDVSSVLSISSLSRECVFFLPPSLPPLHLVVFVLFRLRVPVCVNICQQLRCRGVLWHRFCPHRGRPVRWPLIWRAKSSFTYVAAVCMLLRREGGKVSWLVARGARRCLACVFFFLYFPTFFGLTYFFF